MEPDAAQTSPEFDVRDLVAGASLLAATANVIMQLARPGVGYGVVESTVESAQLMRHPVRRWLTTVTYLSVALMGTPAERAEVRHMINRSHAQVRSTADSPVAYSAFDPGLQLWIAACLYQGTLDVHTALRGALDDQTADGMYQVARWFGSTLQMPAGLWPADRAAFRHYWESALASVRIDPPVRDYLTELVRLAYLPRPLGAVLGPVNQFLTTGFLASPFRDQMDLTWTDREQRQFEAVLRAVGAISRMMPGPARRFPFNACLVSWRCRRLLSGNVTPRG
ncbi:MAG TPA: oxygenase MpaB family protein [Streptosporangiaceae bacterium]|nr:oxygenase MpaB family protein [Streptosporangiaceae bacterium]